MTVSEIVKDLLKYKMITEEAALVLLTAEAEAIAYRNQGFQGLKTSPYDPPFKVGDVDWTGSPNPIWSTTTTNHLSKIEE